MATRAVPLHKSGRTIPSEINGYAHFRLAYERPRTNGPTLSKAPELSRPHRRASFLRIGHDADNPRKVKRSSPRQLPTFPNSCAEPKKHGPFQNELVSVFRLAEAVEEALQCVARQNETEILAGAGGEIQKLLADGCCGDPGFDRLQVRASMYGLITFVTRQTLAACQRSAVVAFRFLIDSRRASSTTSSPILFRYLKQSATVLAPEKMRTGTPSTLCVSWPNSSDCFEKRTIRIGGLSERGRRSFSPIAIQISNGLSVPMS